MNITEICAYLKNYFPPADLKISGGYIHTGVYTISGGNIAPLEFILPNQYFRIVGSRLNDGVFQNTETDLKELQDETFDGAIWEMSLPRGFVKLCEDIEAWRQQNEGISSPNMSPFVSESFGGYSYNKASGGNTSADSGSATLWENQFAPRLAQYRRL